tara:strand:- start:44 stop:280 length:237 start_codon:yes stop_codon:yes gene_type:complete
MHRIFEKYSFQFFLDLLCLKHSAESRGDSRAVDSLKKHYPEFYTTEFDDLLVLIGDVMKEVDTERGSNLATEFKPYLA